MDSTRARIMVFLALTFILSQSALAQGPIYGTIATKINDVLCQFFNVFWNIIGVLAVVVILAASVQWIISRDEPAKRKQSQKIIIAVIIGLILAAITVRVIDGVADAVGLPGVDALCAQVSG